AGPVPAAASPVADPGWSPRAGEGGSGKWLVTGLRGHGSSPRCTWTGRRDGQGDRARILLRQDRFPRGAGRLRRAVARGVLGGGAGGVRGGGDSGPAA